MRALIEQHLTRVLLIIFHFVFFLTFIRFFVVETGFIDGQSMDPTFKDNEIFFINKITPLVVPLKRFDVIQHFHPFNKIAVLLKRIIGLPGETVIFRINSVYIRGKDGIERWVYEPYLSPEVVTNLKYGQYNEFVVPEYSYFVLGDNRQYSGDSREYGPVHRSLISGKVITWYRPQKTY